MEHICFECKKEFKKSWKNQKFCNNLCYYKYRKGLKLPKKGTNLICPTCNKEFYVMQSRKIQYKIIHCSKECYWKALRQNERPTKTTSLTCKNCNKIFTYEYRSGPKRNFCSRKCQRQIQFRTSRQISICDTCNKEFECSKYSVRKYCSDICRTKSHDTKKRLAPMSKNGVRRAFIRRGLITHCHECGYKDHPEILGIHHKDEDRTNNSFDNLIVLCPNCHSIRHIRHVNHCCHYLPASSHLSVSL